MEIKIEVAYSFLNSNSRLFLGVFFAREPIAPRTSVVHYESTRMATHTHTHTNTQHLCPQRIFPRFGMFRLGIRGAPPRAVLTDDTINQQFLFSSLLVSGRRTFQSNYFQGRERQASAGWHGWDGRAGNRNYARFTLPPWPSNLSSLNADPPGAGARGADVDPLLRETTRAITLARNINMRFTR